MQIEIDDELVERIKTVLVIGVEKGLHDEMPLEVEIEGLIEGVIKTDEQKLGLAPKEDKMFRTKTWIPVEVDPKKDVLYSRREDAEEEKARLEEMQPENRYEIEEVV